MATSPSSTSTPAAPQAAFLEKVMKRAALEDLYDARDISEVVFRTMRDLMTTEAADHVAAELSGNVASTSEKALRNEVVELWQDTNPIVRFLSRVRPPLEIADDTFLFRISQEAGLSRGISPEAATEAVFSAVKEELSSERIQEITPFLPGAIQQMWRRA